MGTIYELTLQPQMTKIIILTTTETTSARANIALAKGDYQLKTT